MRISISVLYIYIIIWVFEGIPVINGNSCSGVVGTNIVYVCTLSEVTGVGIPGVFVENGRAPIQQSNNCTCVITPTSSTSPTSLMLADVSKSPVNDINRVFKIKDVTLSDIGPDDFKVNISEPTSLLYTSQITAVGGACLWIGTTIHPGSFNIQCLPQTIHSTVVEPTSTSTADHHTNKRVPAEVDEQTSDPDTEAVTKSNTPLDINKTDMTLIGAIVGSVVGVILIVLAVVLLVICCNRRRKSGSTETNDEDAYGMEDNPAYGHVIDVALVTRSSMAIEHLYTEPDFTNKDSNSDYDYTTHTSANNKVFSKKTPMTTPSHQLPVM